MLIFINTCESILSSFLSFLINYTRGLIEKYILIKSHLIITKKNSINRWLTETHFCKINDSFYRRRTFVWVIEENASEQAWYFRYNCFEFCLSSVSVETLW